MPVTGGEVQRRHPAHRRVAARCPPPARGNRVALLVKRRVDQRQHIRGQADVRAVRGQLGDDRGPVLPGGEHERRLAIREVTRVRIGPMLDQMTHGVDAARHGRHHQRRRAGCRRVVDVGARRHKRVDHRRAAVLAGQIERRDGPNPGLHPHVRLRLEQHGCHVEIVVEGRPVQRRHPVALRGVHVAVGRVGQQRAHGPEVAVHRRVGQRTLSRRRARAHHQREDDHPDRGRPTTAPDCAPGHLPLPSALDSRFSALGSRLSALGSRLSARCRPGRCCPRSRQSRRQACATPSSARWPSACRPGRSNGCCP